MRDSIRFTLSDTANILHAGSGGLSELQEALRAGHSIVATTNRDTPVRALPTSEQRLFVQTAGSSGAPKVIRRGPQSWLASFATNQSLFEITPNDTYAVLGHLSHSLALYGAMEAMHLGCGLTALADLSPKRQHAVMREFGASVIYATPTQLRMIAKAATAPLSDVRLVLCGGGKLDPALRATLADLLPKAQVLEFFGASETSFITLADRLTPAGSVGRAYPEVELRIDQGEIWVKSPFLFEGYEKGHSHETRWRDGYLSIGEMGYLDAGGYLFLQGRRTRMVTVADRNVFPEEVEATLLAHPGIHEAAVITPPDPLRGHSIIAVVVGDADEADLRAACREALDTAAIPRTFRFRSELPKLPAGKPDLQLLLKRWQEGHL